jgi:hypothetical protein
LVTFIDSEAPPLSFIVASTKNEHWLPNIISHISQRPNILMW